MTAKIFMYVRKEEFQDFVDAGWISHGALEGTHHGRYAVFMEWTKDENPIIPRTNRISASPEAGERGDTA